MVARSSARSSMRSASRWIAAARSARPIRGHGPSSNALRALAMARSASFSDASAAWAHTSRVQGFQTSKRLPSIDSTSSLSMMWPKNWSSLMGSPSGVGVGLVSRGSGAPRRSAMVTSPAPQWVVGTSRMTTRMLSTGASTASAAAWVSAEIRVRSCSGVRPSTRVTSMSGMRSAPSRR